jgi:hypothetical protein
MSLPVCPSAFIRRECGLRLSVVVDALDDRRCGGTPRITQKAATIGEVAVHGGAGDSQHFRDIGGRDALLPELAGFGGIGVVDRAGRPNFVPLARDAARFRAVRSLISSHSYSASDPRTPIIIRPAEVDESMPSVVDTSVTPRRIPAWGLHSVHLVREKIMPTIEAHLRREMHKYAVELRKLAYTLPNGVGEHDLLEMSELMNIAADETPKKYK